MLCIASTAADQPFVWPSESRLSLTFQRGSCMANPVLHFEIPVTDMDRAVVFYQRLFGFEFDHQTVDGYEMAFFPRNDNHTGTSGALVKGDVYKPSRTGCILYFDVDDIDEVLRRAQTEGSVVLYAKKDIGTAGFVAEIEDSEGNRIALNAMHR
ncbi:VOC family protein [Labrenzia sp. VG12]|uniref:VOC family protein n=1 Tax=Labrenzia sp. VG12 TaxID=2021862 RepID=UPI0018DF109C|nr:VOC family protein [Labrenzia sp. VG12]